MTMMNGGFNHLHILFCQGIAGSVGAKGEAGDRGEQVSNIYSTNRKE